MGGGMKMESKEGDSTFVALKNETLGKFKQLTYEDSVTCKTMQYNLLVPDGYDGTRSFPLVLFMADASTVGKDVTTPLKKGTLKTSELITDGEYPVMNSGRSYYGRYNDYNNELEEE